MSPLDGDFLISAETEISIDNHCVLLFDIDGTLIDSQGAGGGALLRAAREQFNNPDIQAVPLHGRTDFGIMSEMLENAGIPATVENLQRLCDAYFGLLKSELQKRQGRVLPGVTELLEKLASDPRCHLGIVTGNMPQSAQIKLEHFRLWDYFRFGAYGHAAPQRRDLRDPAWQSIREYAVQHVDGHKLSSNVVIIGDTVLDVDLALAMNVRCLAVCTGGSDADSLSSAGAHHVTNDLTDTHAILRWFFSAPNN